jgi:ABC-type polysaccharide/polyol phosphate export permease
MSLGAALTFVLGLRVGPAALLLLLWFVGLGVVAVEMAVRFRSVGQFTEWAPYLFFWLTLVAGCVLLLASIVAGSGPE